MSKSKTCHLVSQFYCIEEQEDPVVEGKECSHHHTIE